MKRFYLTTTLAAVHALAFENKAGWKLDADGKIEMKDGNPVYVKADGTESVVDAGTIGNLNSEAKGHRERAEAAETKLKAFDGIDPEAARKAIDTVSKLDAKQLIDAGEVDKVKSEIAAQFQTQLDEQKSANTDLQSRLDAAAIGLAVAQSKYIGENIAIPPEMFISTFTKNFKVENGKVVAYDLAGNPIHSKEKFGEPASVDEAFSIMVEAYPHKDSILKAADARGSGGTGDGGNRGGNAKRISRSDFDQLAPAKQAEIATAASKGEMQIVD